MSRYDSSCIRVIIRRGGGGVREQFKIYCLAINLYQDIVPTSMPSEDIMGKLEISRMRRHAARGIVDHPRQEAY